MNLKLPEIQSISVAGKKVLLRADLDVPIVDEHITDDSRLLASEKTLHYLLDHGARVILVGHLGRPDGEVKSEYSLLPIAKWYEERGKEKAAIIDTQLKDFAGWKFSENFFLLENIRFYKGEEENDEAFAKNLSSLADIYVDDAFAVSHRAHASMVGVTKFLPSYAGFELAKEVETLTKVMTSPARPLVMLIGGAKVETKLPLAEKMLRVADTVLVGGKIAMEKDAFAKLGDTRGKLVLGQLNAEGTDMTEESALGFVSRMKDAKTIVWNGPVGKTEEKGCEKSSLLLAQGILSSGAFSIVGGGDTLEFLQSMGLLSKFSFVSTGGGAMLSLLSGEELPAVVALEQQ